MLSVESISYSYKKRGSGTAAALRDVTFTAQRGSVTAIVGPNGSGKSTLFRIITGLLTPDSGTVLEDGRAVRRETMGVVFQSPSLDTSLTAFENIAHHAMLHGRRVKRDTLVPSVVEASGLREFLDTRVEALSGGYRRRVELVKALISEPRLLVLDEAFNALDTNSRRQFFSLLRSLTSSKGLITLLITHIPALASQCDQVVALSEGGIVGSGGPADLLDDLGASVVEIETDDAAALEHALITLGITTRFMLPSGAMLLPRTSLAALVPVLELLAVPPSRVLLRPPTIEDWLHAQVQHARVATEEVRYA